MPEIKAMIIILIGLVLVFFVFYGAKVFAGTLSCTVRSPNCNIGEVTIWKMSGTSNAHAGLPSQTNYTTLVCCSGVSGLGTNCTGTFATVLKLSGTSNAHSEQNSQTNYTNNVCISVPSGGSVSVGYQANNCTGFDTTLGSMSGTTNAHVGDTTAYTTKICASASAAADPTISFSISANTLDLGNLNTSRVNTNSHTVTITTNASSGYVLYVSDDGNLRQGANDIDDVADGAVTAGSEEYGLATSDSGQQITQDTNCSSPPFNASAITTSTQTAASSDVAVPAGETTTLCYAAAVSASTIAGVYSHIVTYVVTGRF